MRWRIHDIDNSESIWPQKLELQVASTALGHSHADLPERELPSGLHAAKRCIQLPHESQLSFNRCNVTGGQILNIPGTSSSEHDWSLKNSQYCLTVSPIRLSRSFRVSIISVEFFGDLRQPLIRGNGNPSDFGCSTTSGLAG